MERKIAGLKDLYLIIVKALKFQAQWGIMCHDVSGIFVCIWFGKIKT